MSKYFVFLFLLLQQSFTYFSINAVASSDCFEVEYTGFCPKLGKRYAVGVDYKGPEDPCGFNDFGHVSGGWVFRALRDAGMEFSKEAINYEDFFVDASSCHVTYKKPLAREDIENLVFYATLKNTTDMTINCLVEMVTVKTHEESLYAYGEFIFLGRDTFGRTCILPEYFQNMGDTGILEPFPKNTVNYEFSKVLWPKNLLEREINSMKELDGAYLFHVLDVAGKGFCETILGVNAFGDPRKVVTASSFYGGGVIPSDSALELRACLTNVGQKSMRCRVEFFSPIDALVNAFGEFTFVHAVKGAYGDVIVPQPLPFIEWPKPKL